VFRHADAIPAGFGTEGRGCGGGGDRQSSVFCMGVTHLNSNIGEEETACVRVCVCVCVRALTALAVLW